MINRADNLAKKRFYSGLNLGREVPKTIFLTAAAKVAA